MSSTVCVTLLTSCVMLSTAIFFKRTPMHGTIARLKRCFVGALCSIPLAASAQQHKLLVVSSDSQPIAYAYVTVNGGSGVITDEKGEIGLGAGRAKTITVNVRRIGYAPWFGQLAMPDTAAVLRVTLGRIAQTLSTVSISESESRTVLSLTMRGFYNRWEMRQKGLLSATFIGPEELEFRHPDKITNVLRGLNGVSFRLSIEHELVAFGLGGQCQMAIVVDGIEQCASSGCQQRTHGASITGGGDPVRDGRGGLSEQNAVLIDRVLEANDISAIEIYPRGGNMPISLQVPDTACGVIAFWTGSRKP